MKKVILKIGCMMICLAIFSSKIYATEENIVNSTVDTASNEITQEQKEEKPEEKQEAPTETKKNEKMYVQERCNIRKSYSVDSERVGGLDAGTEVTVVAEYSNGWYKIQYDGGEAYIKAGILRSTPPKVEEPPEEPEEQQPQPTENVVSSVEQENNYKEDEEYAKLINEIGVLPEVGQNLADSLYFGVVILVIVMLVVIKKKLLF